MARLYYLRTDQPIPQRRSSSPHVDLVPIFTAFIQGILADGVVNPAEAKALHKLVESNRRAIFEGGYPLIELARRIDAFTSDGIWTPDELTELTEILSAFNESAPSLSSASPASPATFIFDKPPPSIVYPNQEFVITGTFAYGPRALIIDEIESRGALMSTNPRRSTSYLVVGSFVSEGWSHGSYGRKIEAALALRDQQKTLAIISEETWRASLNEQPLTR